MAKRSSSVRTSFNIINIKLRQPDARESTTQENADMIMALYNKKIKVKINSTTGIIIRRCFRTTFGNKEVIVGYLSRFTPVEGQEWIDLENPDSDAATLAAPKNAAPGLRDTVFYFIPSIHRLSLIRGSNTLTPQFVATFFVKAISKLLGSNQAVDVEVLTSKNYIEELKEASAVTRLEIEISYTNNDFNFDSLIDDELKNAGIGKLKLVATADTTGSIDIEKSKLIEQALKLAIGNGSIAATVKPQIGARRKKIDIDEHQRVETVVSEIPADQARDVAAFMINEFSNSNGES
ncbi:DUF4747 family protein [Hymenobacter canadensis]|uniref:DUF4747 family protein n=1 Tax=Hymenobacter canadensis TaxID=2999067 RepID=A0ABY7LVC1_9BACT|nr:DUF4747 family protein [Hymenobacter canadensis]WBA44329.1 DUF4747 family protein [Hymenobacter canadensis]